jgi:hypothetical protein
MKFLLAMQLPHWLMAVGALFLVVGFLGLAFRKNRESQPPAAQQTPMQLAGRASGSQGVRPAGRDLR